MARGFTPVTFYVGPCDANLEINRRFHATLRGACDRVFLNIPSHELDGYRWVCSQETNSRCQRPYTSHGQQAGTPEAQAVDYGDGAVQAQQRVAA
jgi:hypothetical protein